MRFRTFPGTDISVSEIGFGVWTVSTSWWGITEPSTGIKLLQRAFDLGVTLFDTADTYGNGYGEEILVQALPRHRHHIVIGTKFGYDWYAYTGPRSGHKELPQNYSPQFVRYACEQSLKRLKTDYIDLYQMHNPRLWAIQSDEVIAILEQLQREGKIRYYGAALGPDIGWFEEGEAAMRERRMTVLQIIYSLLEQDPARRFFPIARETGSGLLVRVPHASGLLEGPPQGMPTFAPTDHRSFRKQEWLESALKKVERLQYLTQDKELILGQAALKFCLAEPRVVSVLPNFLTEEQVVEFCRAPECPDLTQEEVAQAWDLYDHNFYLEEAAALPA